jgi:hypothetical protein
MNKLPVISSGCITVALFIYGYTHIEKQQKESYDKKEQAEYSIEFKKDLNVIAKFPSEFIKYDSIRLYERTIEGCRWAISANGEVALHTIRNCPSCTEFFVSLSREP